MAHKKYESNKQKFATKLAAAYPSLEGDADEVFATFAALDPTASQKSEQNQYVYLDWICLNVLKEKPLPQDFYKIRDDLNTYMLLNRLDKFRARQEGTIYYRPFVNAHIGHYSISSLSESVFTYQNQIKDRKVKPDALNEERQIAEAQSIILYDGPEGRIVSPQSTAASQYWGRATKWCISATKSDNLFNQYNNDGLTPTIMFLPKGTSEKYAFNEHDKSPTRNALDRAILNKRKPLEADSPYIEGLGDFLIKALGSVDFKQDEIEANHNLKRAFQAFVVWHPPIYEYVVKGLGEHKIPAFWKMKEIGQSVEEIAKIGELDPNLDVLDRITHLVLTIPDKPFEHPQDYLDDFSGKYSIISQIEETGAWHENENVGQFVMAYMKIVPKEFWEDEEFSVQFIEQIAPVLDESIKAFPEAYDHPKVLRHLVTVIDVDNLPQALGTHPFTKAWTGHIDGVPTLEVIPDHPAALMNRVVVENIYDAKFLYQAAERAEGLDFSPLVRKIEALYPDGFDNPEDVGFAGDMPRCDLTTLLEKTVVRDPSLFADVAPEIQTLPMAIAAVQHDPGSLADMAAHLFAGKARAPELTAAYNKLPPDSIERGAVADYFTVPEVR